MKTHKNYYKIIFYLTLSETGV